MTRQETSYKLHPSGLAQESETSKRYTMKFPKCPSFIPPSNLGILFLSHPLSPSLPLIKAQICFLLKQAWMVLPSPIIQEMRRHCTAMATCPFPLRDNSLACSYKQTVLHKVSLWGFRKRICWSRGTAAPIHLGLQMT